MSILRDPAVLKAYEPMQLHPTSRLPAAPIRIGLLTPTLLMGGAERWMLSLARCCDRRRIEWIGTALTDWAPASPELCREMTSYMPVYAGPDAGTTVDPCDIIRCPSGRAAIEAVLFDSDMLVTWGINDLARLVEGYRKPVVLVSHGSGEWATQAIRSSESGATHFVSVSDVAKRPFSPEIRKRTTILHNGIDVPRCTPSRSPREIRADWGFDNSHRLIGYVGRYSAEKNPIAAAMAAVSLGDPYHAVYAGEGWMEADLRKQVGRVAGPRAQFVPRVERVGDVLSALDAFVLASPAEGFSLSMAEAWYCNIPVVATRVGAVPELEDHYGQLVAPVPVRPTPAAMASAVEDALSPGFRSEVLPRAHAMVCTHFTAAAMASRWTDYLEGIYFDR